MLEFTCNQLTKMARCLPAELAHNLALSVTRNSTLSSLLKVSSGSNAAYRFSDLHSLFSELRHPVGLAAGFDKNAIACKGMANLGFSFLEVGTVTKRPQKGNSKPRMFRLVDQMAIVNRMGFNNDGVDSAAKKVELFKKTNHAFPVGINIGKNKETPLDVAIEDYLFCYEKVRDVCDYIVVNISSPNTPDLRNLATTHFVANLAANVLPGDRRRIFVKLDPDLSKGHFQDLIAEIVSASFGGVILSNTMKVSSPQRGGLSGHPLLSSSNQLLEWAYEVHKGNLFTIASGGVLTGIDVFNKISRGAHLVQIYSALVYRGPFVVKSILRELAEHMHEKGFDHISDLRCSIY